MSAVRIFQLDRAFSQWIWLCTDHLARRKAMNFLVKADKDPPHDDLTCDDCHFGEPTTTQTTGATDGTGV